MLRFIKYLVLSNNIHRVHSKLSDVFKIGTYASFFVISTIIFSSSTLAKTVCIDEMVKEEDPPTLSSELIDAMYEAISSNEFNLDEPYTVMSEIHFCAGAGDKQTVTQTRADGTRTWTYTNMNRFWILTEYKYTPVADKDSLPDEP
ncbi:hypothetical protein ACFOEW_13345 [Alteromonas oceani]|uniref:Uncharacterized protein n=1 Tax=Alteromonas oceani TaxID=2071609 RepID=A0ABV7K1C4_9ALTE|nr:hypothetical protein [Alteromonas oceani]